MLHVEIKEGLKTHYKGEAHSSSTIKDLVKQNFERTFERTFWRPLDSFKTFEEYCNIQWVSESLKEKGGNGHVLTKENWNKSLSELFPGQTTIHLNHIAMVQVLNRDDSDLEQESDYSLLDEEPLKEQNASPIPGYVQGGAIGLAGGLAVAGTIGILTACGEQGTIAAVITPLLEVHTCMPWVTAAIGLVVCTGAGALIGWLATEKVEKTWANENKRKIPTDDNWTTTEQNVELQYTHHLG